jgi:hypothetical protein
VENHLAELYTGHVQPYRQGNGQLWSDDDLTSSENQSDKCGPEVVTSKHILALKSLIEIIFVDYISILA